MEYKRDDTEAKIHELDIMGFKTNFLFIFREEQSEDGENQACQIHF